MTRLMVVDVDLQQSSGWMFVGWESEKYLRYHERKERGKIVGGHEQRGVVEVMMAAPAPVTPWLSFPGAG